MAAHPRDRQLAKSAEQVDAQNYPRLVRRTNDHLVETTIWAVESRTRDRTIYLVTERIDRRSGERALACECPAARCWHRVHVERGSNGEIPIVEVRRWDGA